MKATQEMALEDASSLARSVVLVLAKIDDYWEVLTKANDVQAAKLRNQLRVALITQMAQMRGISLHLDALARGERLKRIEATPEETPTP